MRTIQFKLIPVMLSVSLTVFLLALLALSFGDALDQALNVIGIRIAMLFMAFMSFLSTSLFSLLIILHNKTVLKINDDTNKRAEMFRELQFVSSNYSIIEFMDRMLIYQESTRYIDRFIGRKSAVFHMFESKIEEDDVYKKQSDYLFLSLKIPFRVIEGKTVSNITFDRLKFERNEEDFMFVPGKDLNEGKCFLLYNEHTKRNNVIINLVVLKEGGFFNPSNINDFSKIKIHINITSLLGVKVKGVSELYFTNPLQIEGDGSNTYKINSANFTLVDKPKIIDTAL